MSDRPVLLSTTDGVARVELARPPVNALDAELVAALAQTVVELEALEPRAVVFSGGPKTLAAGGDVTWMLERAEAGDRGAIRGFLRAIQKLFDDVEALPVPTLALVRGHTLGGGLELALACDLRVASSDAVVGFPEARLGLLPGAGGTQRVTELLGRSRALELLYTGRRIDAGEALRLGLVNRVAPPESVEEAARELLDEVLGATDDALAAIKACIRANVHDGRAAGLLTENGMVERLALGAPARARLQEFQRRRQAKAARPEPELQGA
jgi:enoyl-CoA hydratase/carnithine racemase